MPAAATMAATLAVAAMAAFGCNCQQWLLTQGEKGVFNYFSFAAMVRVVLGVAAWAVALLASMGWLSIAHHTAWRLSSDRPLQSA